MEGATGRAAATAKESVDLDRDTFGQLLDGELDAEVVRDRVEAAGMHDPRAGLDGSLVVADIHTVEELGLAGQVEIVGAGVGTSRHQRFAVLDVGTDRRRHDSGRLGQGLERLPVRDVRDDDVLAESFELLAVASGNGPAEPRWRVLREILRGQCAGEPGRTEEQNVVLAAHSSEAF